MNTQETAAGNLRRKAKAVLASVVVATSAMAFMPSSTYAMTVDTAKYYTSQVYSNTDIGKPSGISKEEFVDYCRTMRNDKGGFYSRNAEFIWDTCHKIGFNEFVFIGVSAWEGGWATQGPSYNYYGTLGMRYSSEHDGIEGWISFMKKNYATPGGRYYHGKGLVNVGPTYCSSQWAWDVLRCIQDSARRK